MLVADPRDPALDELGRQLSVLGLHRQQLDAGDRLGRAALVDVHVRDLRADHRLPRAARGTQRQHVGSAAGEHEERAGGVAEVLGEHRLDALCVVVMAVAERVPDVGAGDRRENVGMDRCRVVGGEAARVHAASLAFSEL